MKSLILIIILLIATTVCPGTAMLGFGECYGQR